MKFGVVMIVWRLEDYQVLLVRSSKRLGAAGTPSFELPAGKVLLGESFAAAAVRELREETGMEAMVMREVGQKNLGLADYDTRYIAVSVLNTGFEPRAGSDALEALWGNPALILRGAYPEDHAVALRVRELAMREQERVMNTTRSKKAAPPDPKRFDWLETMVAGPRHHVKRADLELVKLGDTLDLVCEPTNPVDPNAVRVEHGGAKLGYISATQALMIGRMLRAGYDMVGRVDYVDASKFEVVMTLTLPVMG